MSTHGTIGDGCLRIQHADIILTLDPTQGGAIREFCWRGTQIFRPALPDARDDPFEFACFPLVPFANRIANGRFEFDGRTVQIATNSDCSIHPLHGQGWKAPWKIAAQSPSSVTLAFYGGGDEWPWRYRAQQIFQIEESALNICLSVENLAETPMPAMLGLHPYFHDAARARLQAETPRVWLADESFLPVEEVSAPVTWRFNAARSVNTVALDHCFTGWNGAARIEWPDRNLFICARNCDSLHIYTPEGQDFFCVEPQAGAAGALNRGGHEAAIVQPGEFLAIDVSFELGDR